MWYQQIWHVDLAICGIPKEDVFSGPGRGYRGIFRWSNHSLIIHSGHSGLPNTFDMLYGAGTYDLGLLTLKMTQSCRNKCELWVYEWFHDGGNLLRHLRSHISKSFGLGFFFQLLQLCLGSSGDVGHLSDFRREDGEFPIHLLHLWKGGNMVSCSHWSHALIFFWPNRHIFMVCSSCLTKQHPFCYLCTYSTFFGHHWQNQGGFA